MNKKRFDEFVESVKQGGAILRGELQPSRTFELQKDSQDKTASTWAICLKTDDPELLIPFKVYHVHLSGKTLIGVIDEIGESAIYPAENFLILNLPPSAEKRLSMIETAQ